MIRFAENVTNLVATVKSLDQRAYLSNPILIRQLVNKLPAAIKTNWGKRAAKGEIDTYALLDGGATVSLISDEIANQLRLKGPKRPLITS